MIVQIAMKNAGNIAKRVKTIPFALRNTPETFAQLLEETVRASVAAYRLRMQGKEGDAPLTDEEFAAMQEVGKFAWGFLGEQTQINEEKAIACAKQAVEDGLVRVFMDDRELTAPDTPLTLSGKETFTFIKLTMLAGRLW